MRELTAAVISLPWAMSLFGMEQLALLFGTGSGTGRREAGARLYRATQAMQDQMDDALWATFQVGDALQRSAVDLVCDAMDARRWEAAMTQLRNNLEVFNLVKGVRTVLSIPDRDVFELAGLVEEAYGLGHYPDLWAIEGLGHDYADRFWSRGAAITGILRDDESGAIPRSSLTMLHAGMGLAFAKHLLADVTPYDSADEVHAVSRTFVALCLENSRPGYEGAALESLGLVTRTWHPQMVSRLDESLGDIDQAVREYFWHGAGRALYFHPLYIVPGVLSPWHAADREPPDDTARLNMKAGLAWATVLVNIRQPAILAEVIRRHGPRVAADDAFASGAVSAIAMAQDITPDDEYIAALCAVTAAPPDGPVAAARWESLIAGPCLAASGRVQRALADAERLGELFRYHPYPEWFDALARPEPPPVHGSVH
jgi:hypothetical protein